MTELSPAAQSVLDAAFEPWETVDKPELIAAAALRAAALYCKRDRLQLIAIAAELEGAGADPL